MNLVKKNFRRPWTPEEDNQLGEMAAAGKSVTLIALRLKRTEMAVRGRMRILRIPVRKQPRRVASHDRTWLRLEPEQRQPKPTDHEQRSCRSSEYYKRNGSLDYLGAHWLTLAVSRCEFEFEIVSVNGLRLLNAQHSLRNTESLC